ncbi:MAG: hypothetical protein JO157_07575 [Acetobacteraceae bacterium]|nr:hypothetical protein [Acetobacteraceae bacterium]
MAMRSFTRLYDDHEDAAHVVQALEASGIPHADISLVASNVDRRHDTISTHETTGTADSDAGSADVASTSAESVDAESTGAGAGATVGTILGGGAGLLAGVGLLAIPGVGPIVAAGWLVATITGAGVGAAGGGILGSLVGAGVPEEHAHVYAEGVRRGGTLVTVRADESQADQVDAILDQRAPVDPALRQADYQQAGWTGFDPAAPPLTTDEVVAERQRRVRVS